MPSLLLYLLKVSISLAVVFLFYQLVLRRLTFYNWNRLYLLAYTLLSFFVPFIDISPFLQKNALTDSGVVNWVPVIRQAQPVEMAVQNTGTLFSLVQFISVLIISGMLIMLARLCVQVVSFRRMRRKAIYISGTGMKIFQVNENIIPFSFGKAVFVNTRLHNESELREIILHEFVHLRQRHSIDILWSEFLCLVSWFNPFAWLLKKAIRQNLEFIADNKVLENGINKKEYQYLLLKVSGNNQYSIATPFNFSSLKKRIAMMNKLKTARVHLVKFLFLLPLAAVLLLAFRSERKKEKPAVKKDQHVYIAGLVVDVSTKEPLGEAEIYVKERNIRIKTDEKGYYLLEIPYENKPLSFTMLVSKPGYASFYQQENWGNFHDDDVREKYSYTFEFFGLGKKGRKNSGFSSLAGNAKEIEGLNYPEALKKIRKILYGYSPEFASDTVPHPTALNSKGYQIRVMDNKGNSLLVIKDKKGKEVKRILLDEWNRNAASFESMYGEIPPPPPPVPFTERVVSGVPMPPAAPEVAERVVEGVPAAPPAPGLTEKTLPGFPLPPAAPSVEDLPEHVRSVQINNNKAKVTLKDGKTENYDLSVPAEKKVFEKKYGAPPSIPVAPAGPQQRSAAANFDNNNNIVTVTAKDGRKEKYNLTDPVQRTEFKTLYGNPVVTYSADKLTVTESSSGPALAKTTSGIEAASPVRAVLAEEETPVNIREISEKELPDVLQIGGLSMQDDQQYVVVDGKEYIRKPGEKLKGTFRITFIDKKEAVKKYGEKARNGAIIAETIR